MAQFVSLKAEGLQAVRSIDERLVSYNVEMTEVTGGTFWKAYTEAQVDGTEAFPVIKDWSNMGKRNLILLLQQKLLRLHIG